MATTRSRKWMYTEASARQIAERAERKSLSRSRSVSCERSSDTSYSSFWESSDCDVSLSGFSSQSDSELVSPESSSTVEKETADSSDEEIPVQVKTRSDYHSDSEDSDEPSRPTQRRKSARSRRGTARGRSRGTRGGASRGSTRTRGGGSGRGRYKGRRGGKRACSKQYPHSIPEEAVSIEVEDEKFATPPPFQPIREVGPHLPDDCESPLELFELFFDSNVVNRIIRSTKSYAEHKKEEKKGRYVQFTKKPLTYAEVMSFLGVLILLGIHNVRNYRKAFSEAKAQVLIRLHDLMTCQRFELIGSFIHVVTMEEESSLGQDPLKKIRPLQEYIKRKCLSFYQPLQNLSVDERMVKSKARCHLVQYMRNKPCKWGFKYWVLADTSGYTVDFELYTGKMERKGENGLAYDVVMHLCQNFKFQGYLLYVDNFYTGVALFEDLAKLGIAATGTLRIDRRGVPDIVKQLQKALSERIVPRGHGYYIRTGSLVYVCWRDKRTVTAMSVALPGHGAEFVERRVKGKEGVTHIQILCPVIIREYNRHMGGVDKSDQYMAYHNVLRRTVRFWKTPFYHLIDIGLVNSFILYNILQVRAGRKVISENDFRDKLVLEIISKYGVDQRPEKRPGRPSRSDCRVRHGSMLLPVSEKSRCQYCRIMHGQVNWTQRKCLDCIGTPGLCQTAQRDCHSAWHYPSFDRLRNVWFDGQLSRQELPPNSSQAGSSSQDGQSSQAQPSSQPAQEARQRGKSRRRGRPRGAINKRRRRGNYRKRLLHELRK